MDEATRRARKETEKGATQMNIGIIGAGSVGTSLATAAKRAGHNVLVSSSKAADAQKLAGSIGAAAAASNREAIQGSDIVILAVPFDAVEAIVREAGDAAQGKVIIDVSNRFDPAQLNGKSNAELIQEMVPASHVVKAFNTVLAARQSDPPAEGIQLDGFVAGEEGDAKSRALDFVRSLGFRPIDVGTLAMARALEGMGTLNINLNISRNLPWQNGWKLLGPSA
ncbi:MAG TPA: NADPH-dependent F420 reductase [Fimbriimonas sp.]